MIIKNIGSYAEEKIILDDYIPVEVKFAHIMDLGKDRILYWRIGDFKKSLMEIRISENSCKIVSITLTLFEKIKKNLKLYKNVNDISKKEGLPIIDIKYWSKNRYLDVNKKFEVGVDHNSIIIKIQNKNIKSKIINGNVIFGIGKNNDICRIEIINIEKKKTKNFVDRFK